MRKVIKGLILLFIFFVSLELVLQIASLIQNKILNKQMLMQQAKNIKKNNEKQQINILCVGDSFTQGVGASDRNYSYPMQLNKYLQNNFFYNWNVFNCGVATTNSSEVVKFLPKLLEYYSPDYLCILIGINDSWNLNLTKESSFEEKFDYTIHKKKFIPWKLIFRTHRLYNMIVKYFRDIRESRDGAFNIKKNKAEFKKGQIKKPENIQDLFNFGMQLLSEKKFQDAVEVFNKILTLDPNYLDAQIQLAYSLVGQKRNDEALNLALPVRQKIMDQPLRQHINLAWFFMHVGDFKYAYNEVEQYRKYFPDDLGVIYQALGNIAFETYDYDTAESYFKKVIKDCPQKAFSYRTLARIYSLQNKQEEAIKLLIQAYLLDKNADLFALYLSIVHSSSPFANEHFIEILNKFREETEINSNSYKELQILCQNMVRRIGGDEVLRKNLYNISTLCLQNGVRPIFITYPMHSSINHIIREFCQKTNASLIDAEEIFNGLLKNDKFEKFFVQDSHLNNEGYRILSEELGKYIINRVMLVQGKK